jgi:predicted RNA methylase
VSVQKPIYSEDYSRHWPVNVEGKTVIDVGADYGSTAYYFLQKGAVRVVCVEGNPALYKQLEANMRFLPNCVAVYKNIESPVDFTDILKNTAETVKVDVEGAEKHLLKVAPSLLQQHYEWIIEMHRNIDRRAFTRHFQSVGFDVVNMFPYGFGLTVIHFLRHDIPRGSLTENLKQFVLLYPM